MAVILICIWLVFVTGIYSVDFRHELINLDGTAEATSTVHVNRTVKDRQPSCLHFFTLLVDFFVGRALQHLNEPLNLGTLTYSIITLEDSKVSGLTGIQRGCNVSFWQEDQPRNDTDVHGRHGQTSRMEHSVSNSIFNFKTCFVTTSPLTLRGIGSINIGFFTPENSEITFSSDQVSIHLHVRAQIPEASPKNSHFEVANLSVTQLAHVTVEQSGMRSTTIENMINGYLKPILLTSVEVGLRNTVENYLKQFGMQNGASKDSIIAKNRP